jgi:predicted nucleic-acid-binding protein
LEEASLIAVSLLCLCEFVWILCQGAKLPTGEVARSICDLLGAGKVVMNRPAVEPRLAMLEAGGDFADEGLWLGSDTFVSFDQEAVALLVGLGQSARLGIPQ